MRSRFSISAMIVAVMAVLCVTSCEWTERDGEYSAATFPRTSAARLYGGMKWDACTTSLPDTLPGNLSCAGPRVRLPASSGTRSVRGQRSTTITPRVYSSQRTSAISDLVWGTTVPGALERAAHQLTLLQSEYPRDAGVLNDLSVALLLVAERSQTLLPALRALDAVERAKYLAPLDPVIAWNLALVLEHLHLPAAALNSWAQVERLETEGPWKSEAQRRRRRVERVLSSSKLIETSDSLFAGDTARQAAAIERSASRMPQSSRERAWTLLGQWGNCVVNGDTSCAARNLGLASRIAGVERRRGGDSSVAEAVARVQAAALRGSAQQRRIAGAQIAFSAALDRYRNSAFDQVGPLLTRAKLAFRDEASAPVLWVDYYLAGSLANRGEYEPAKALFRRLASRSQRRFPIVAGKALLAIGVIEARRGNTELAVAWYRAAQRNLDRARDRETDGYAAFLLAETLGAQGRRLDSQAEALRSIRMNAEFRTSVTLRGQLAHLATLARAEGLPHAAVAIGFESVAIARGIGRPVELALSYRDRARDYRRAGDPVRAMRDLDSAEAWARRIESGRGGDRLRAYINLWRGEVLRSRSAVEAIDPLMRAVTVLRTFRQDIFLPVALREASRTTMLLGDTARTDSLLTEAIAVLESQYEAFVSTTLRATFAETVEDVFDAKIALYLARHNSSQAFEFLERSKRAVYRPGWTTATTASSDSVTGGFTAVRHALQDGTTVIEYAVLPDRLAIWKISRRSAGLVEIPIARDSLAAMVSRAQLLLQGGDSAAAVAASSRLYELLLRRVLNGDPSERSLIIVPDRELFQVSFAALWDRASSRFVIEDHEIRYAPSADFAKVSSRQDTRIPKRSRLLAVGNDAKASPGGDNLPALSHAEAEARQIAVRYAQHELLTGAKATREAIQRSTQRNDLLHFAGHAVFDNARPERSYLLIAGTGDSARFAASEIASLRSSSLRLVILAACQSLNARASRIGPVSGLAYSFLQAGASGSVTSLWDVEDGGSVLFMERLHQYLLSGRSPASALQKAQVDFIRSSDPLARLPRRWAGFTLTGS